jgi:hypothetical protein
MHIKTLSMASLFRFIFTYLAALILFGASYRAHAEDSTSAKNKSPFPVKYRSLVDQNMLIKTVTLAPVYDNMNGIYSKPIQKLLVDLLQSDKAWGYAEIVGSENKFIENYDLNPNDVLEALSKTNAQGLLTAFITKGPRGLSAKLKLFTHDEGHILLEESIDDFNAFEVSKLRYQFVQMYMNLKNKLPYRGYVLSRRGQDVTVSVGTLNGVKVGQELTLAQIIKLNRHPKLKILIGVEKEIIAKAVVTKADEYLSFAQITFEKETGVVDTGAKVLPVGFISYPQPKLNSEGGVIGDTKAVAAPSTVADDKPKDLPSTSNENQTSTEEATNNGDADTSEYRQEVLDRHNSMGSVRLQAVITQYRESAGAKPGSQTVDSSQSFAPGLNVGGHYNIYQDIFAEAAYQQNSFSLGNGLSGSTPSNIGMSYSKLSAFIGYDYNFSEEEDEDAITFTGLLGFAQHTTKADTSSPTAFTSANINSMVIKLRASLPITETLPLTIGGQFELALSPTYSDSPSSGSGSSSLSSFGFFASYKLTDKFNLIGDLNLTSINTNFSGNATRTNPVSNSKIELTNQQVGVEYLF